MAHKNEISVAVIIGLIIGIMIIGGVYRAKTAIDELNRTTTKPLEATKNTTLPESSNNLPTLPLIVTSPQDNSVHKVGTVTLTGQTQKDTYITILTEKNEYIIVPNDVGAFSQEISLVKGSNSIAVTVYTSTGEKSTTNLSLVYTTADL